MDEKEKQMIGKNFLYERKKIDMVRRTKRATLINKDKAIEYINKEEFKEFLKDFLKVSKKKMASPPTELEKALIVSKPLEEIRKKPARKVILPEIVEKKQKLK